MAPSPAAYSFSVALHDEQATRRLAADIANLVEPGDVLTLLGDLGAGKSAFARAFIRHLAGDENAEVPSPTFTLMQSYDLPRFALVHADLYRLSGPDELTELGFDDEADNTVMLIEWPERARGHLPEDRINVALMLDASQGDTFRHCKVTGLGRLAARVERIDTIRRFLDAHGFADAARTRMQGDASSRMYERLTRGDETFILMNSPRRPDGPPVENGKPYSAIAHLAEDVTPFIAIARALSDDGLSAPTIIAADRAAGLIVLEDLGLETVVEGEPPAPIAERYGIATDLLAELHRKPRPNDLPVEPGVSHRVPRFDLPAMLIEVSLLIDWYLPHRGIEPGPDLRAAYRTLWTEALEPALIEPPTWVLRDYHSPNLIWLPQRDGIQRIGLLDFQDAVMGPAAYDVASLLQDARVDVPEELEVQLLVRYLRGREAEDDFVRDRFVHLYALMAAQRASKILGIFARLDKRDGKPQYLRHLPRVWTYLQRALAHPALAPLADWYGAHIPAPDMKDS
ncbi:tRNA (adenosine(37)-N6)-threonylcarbamoyltransferase complex ATPase subunit type 1 TsaE [Undibacter mobilis]|uniref:tRNA threonylcarbamoyladenosine biosynthesis protein TsaE n=1 Tax=Undibacter mobilis TaxID=2292256 RepID=A0A371B997_9BRAD|nr:tRNA (adenosine(37)-N6)-threonylcarbamoyltransferase complex ATPase subunit type 1 TsaE [Undibacter mobilis]RDV04150.1 tRNA (adenosine(37)-N6)-threonylcarbamoyltransferase complex ATPase subunit type 1 TsaE [Undibacter mobilis]